MGSVRFDLGEEDHKEAKIAAIKKGIELKEYLKEAVKAYNKQNR